MLDGGINSNCKLWVVLFLVFADNPRSRVTCLDILLNFTISRAVESVGH